MSKQHWLDSEPGVGASLLQGARLCRAGLRRPWLTLGIATLLGLSLVGVLLFIGSTYAPSFVIRVVEGDRDTSSLPRLKRQLADYVRQGVLTSEPLFTVMRRHALYPSLMRKNPRAALESFREDISIDVYQNYFVEERSAGGAPRSARLIVSYRSKDPMLALGVTRDLGSLIIRHELAARREQALASAGHAEQTRDKLQLALQERSRQTLEKQAEIALATGPDPRLQVELIGLLGSLPALERQLDGAERRAAVLELGAALERRGMGLYFEVVDAGSLPSRTGRLQALLLAFGTCLVIGLPLVAMAIGAFGSQRGAT